MSQITSETLIVNGCSQPYQPQTVRELVRAYGLDPDQSGIAVAANGSVLPRREWETTQLQPGDHIEIVHAQAGG